MASFFCEKQQIFKILVFIQNVGAKKVGTSSQVHFFSSLLACSQRGTQAAGRLGSLLGILRHSMDTLEVT